MSTGCFETVWSSVQYERHLPPQTGGVAISGGVEEGASSPRREWEDETAEENPGNATKILQTRLEVISLKPAGKFLGGV